MTVGVIEFFKVINIRHRQAQWFSFVSCFIHQAQQSVFEMTCVIQAGHFVGNRFVVQTTFMQVHCGLVCESVTETDIFLGKTPNLIEDANAFFVGSDLVCQCNNAFDFITAHQWHTTNAVDDVLADLLNVLLVVLANRTSFCGTLTCYAFADIKRLGRSNPIVNVVANLPGNVAPYHLDFKFPGGFVQQHQVAFLGADCVNSG